MPNTNSEYLRLQALLANNPNYRIMLDTISKAEGTWGKDAYSTKFGGKKIDWRNGKDRKSDGVSNAHGKYQFMNTTWDEYSSKLELTGFSPEEQDIAALALLEKTGALQELDNDNKQEALFKAATIWSSIPKNAKGESAHTYKNGKPQKAKSLSTVLNYMQNNDEAFNAKNNAIEKLNLRIAQKATPEAKKAVIKGYNNYMAKINNDKTLSEEAKNAQRQEVKNKYYRKGNFGIIQSYNANQFRDLNNVISELEQSWDQDNSFSNRGIKKLNTKKYDAAVKKAKALGVQIPLSKDVQWGDTNLMESPMTKLNEIIEKVKSLNVNQVEPNPKKYGYTREEFDAEILKNTPVDTGLNSDSNVPAATGETAQEKADREAAERKQAEADRRILAEKNKPFDSSLLLDKFSTDSMFTDTQFQYNPSKQKIPFDALIGLTTGLVGAAQADDVEIKYRDEQISEGMLQYAQDIAKIKNMGLSPEVEAGLKMKLQDAYQTGLENIVRASNGNRNLVLGNQGQLDKARMHGIVEIAAMDVDRSDKAMAAFGEVQEKINAFESAKAIANNERRYTEDQKKQAAGMEVAKAGMSSFIDAIQNAKENAPGTPNDIARQRFQFNMTGLIPGAKAGEIGSAEYKEAIKVKNQLATAKKQTYYDWTKTLTRDEQDIVYNILEKNPNLDPTKNDGTNFEELKSFYNDVSGTDEYKSEYQKTKGVSNLTSKQSEEEGKAIIGGGPTKDAMTQESQYATPEKVVAPLVGKEIVTVDSGLTQRGMVTQLVKGITGNPTGINTVRPVDMEANTIFQTAGQKRGQKLEQMADSVLANNQKSNDAIDRITNDALLTTEKLKQIKR